VTTAAAALIVWAGLSTGPVASDQEASCDECPGVVWRVRAGSKAFPADGRTWATAFRRVQDAVQAADNGDCIWVASGRYFTSSFGVRGQRFRFDKSLQVYGGFAGYEACLDSRAGRFTTTYLSGEIGTPSQADNAYTIVDVSGPISFGQPSPKVVLDGFHIRGAFSGNGFGGGVYAMDHTVELRNCVIADNVAGYGAGIYARSCRLDLVNCTLRNNRAKFDGGGLWMAGVFSNVVSKGGTNVTNVVFRGNTAELRGGGFYLADANVFGVAPVVFVNALLRDNAAKRGGAGFLEEAQSTNGFPQPGRAEMTNCTIADNAATGGGTSTGAAFVVEDSLYLVARNAQLDLTNCIVWNNLPASPQNPAISATTGEGLLVAYSLLGAGSPHACQPASPCTNEPGCTSFDCDPLFLPGAPYHPDPYASPALDSGFGSLPPDVFDLDGDGDLLENTPLDLDGLPREVGIVDRGAYEAP
jgi:predicted outer membrane repeat protein